MMTALRNRLERLEGHRRPASVAPSVIYVCDTEGEPGAALFMGGGGIERQHDETAEGFKARAETLMKGN